MADGISLNISQIIRITNVTRFFSTTTGLYSESLIPRTEMPLQTSQEISPAACFGFVVLILTTVLGNILVLSALFLDKRLHTPSFFLIANMAIADLLLGIFVLPFSSIHELLNDRWIFGQAFCSTWLALDVLCCTASIIALMAVSIDRYIGVTQPLTYTRTMTTQRTIYLILTVWAISILTSVVPLFGLTDRGTKNKGPHDSETCTINKNTLYTICSSLVSFYIPVVILLILYSRVYQEAKKQGEKLENEKRRLYQIDYQIAFEQVRQQRRQSNGHSKKDSLPSEQLNNHKNDDAAIPLNTEHLPDEDGGLDRTVTSADAEQMKPADPDLKNKTTDDDSSHSGSSIEPKTSLTRRILGERLYSTIKRNSIHSNSHLAQYNNSITPTDELLIIKRKLHDLKREKKAFRAVGLILGALLICWLPFFVTLPIISILKHKGIIQDENTENTWFKITFWLGYFNSALNPFVYAFSNRAIRRAFRQVICRRFCCFMCQKREINEHQTGRRQRHNRTSLTTEISQFNLKRVNSYLTDVCRTIPKADKELNASVNSPFRGPSTGGPVVSFADFLADTGDDEEDRTNSEVTSTATKKNLDSTQTD